MNTSGAGRIWQIWNFLTDATAETKIFLDKICFLFCQENSCFVCFCEKALCEVKFEFWAQSVVELSAQYLFGILKWDKCHKPVLSKISLVILLTSAIEFLRCYFWEFDTGSTRKSSNLYFSLFSSPVWLILYWYCIDIVLILYLYCEEKFCLGHSWGLKDNPKYLFYGKKINEVFGAEVLNQKKIYFSHN